MKTKSSTYFAIIIIFLIYRGVTYAQTGEIRGKLYTHSFLLIKWGNPGENKIALSNNTGFSQTINSNKNGEFFFPNVPVGDYTITVDCKAELKDIGLCQMTGSTKVKVKKSKAEKVKIVVYKF